MGRKFIFFLEEYDQQVSLLKYHKIRSYGDTWQEAFNRVRLPSMQGYSYQLLTLNQYNDLKSSCIGRWFHRWIAWVVLAVAVLVAAILGTVGWGGLVG